MTTTSPRTANVAGTRCGFPSASAVPSLNARAAAKRSRASLSVISMGGKYPTRSVALLARSATAALLSERPHGYPGCGSRRSGMPESPERTALYRLYDADDRLLYVGVSNDPPYRMAQHAKDKPWWPTVATQKLEWLDTREEAFDAEKLAIFTERPKYNHVHNPSPILHELRPMNLHELAGSPWRPFEFIAADLRAFVQSGSLAPGDKFPTTPELMAAYGVSSLTAQHALKLLKAEGFAVGRMGSAVRATLPQGFRNERASVTNEVEGVIELLPHQEGHPPPKLCKALGVDRGTTTS